MTPPDPGPGAEVLRAALAVLCSRRGPLPVVTVTWAQSAAGAIATSVAEAWASIEPFGFFIIIALVFLDPLGFWSQIISPVIVNLMMWIVGVNPFFI